MNTGENAFTVGTDISEDILIDFTAAIDNLDHLGLVVDGLVLEPEENRDLSEYIARSITYLQAFFDRASEEYVDHISQIPIEESRTRRRISKLLHQASEQGARS